MNIRHYLTFAACFGVLQVSNLKAAPDPNFHCYLLFGQSNMAGGAAAKYDGEGTKGVDNYCDTTSRVKVLAWGDCNIKSLPCPSRQLKRTHDQWYTAFPPYHNCEEGIGPADGFGKTLLDSIRAEISIGFVPCALSGQKIAVFQKGVNATIDSYTQPVPSISSGYDWMVKRCKIAQESGVIKGILFHQGEANNGETDWPGKVKGIVDNLKKDLGLWDSIPFIAGEMRYDGCCQLHNTQVNKLPGLIPNCAVASANGLERRLSRPDGQTDQYHFSTKGTKEFGLRYAKAFLSLAGKDYIPRKVTSAARDSKIAKSVFSASTLRFLSGETKVFSLDGKMVKVLNSSNKATGFMGMQPGKVYLVSNKSSCQARLMVLPLAK